MSFGQLSSFISGVLAVFRRSGMKLYEFRFRFGDTLHPQPRSRSGVCRSGERRELGRRRHQASCHVAGSGTWISSLWTQPSTVWLKVAWLQTCRLKQVLKAMSNQLQTWGSEGKPCYTMCPETLLFLLLRPYMSYSD